MLKVVLEEGIQKPTKTHKDDAGYDFYSPESFVIKAGRAVVVDLGVHMGIPSGYVGFIKSRSSMNIKKGVLCDAGVIDAGFTGPIKIKLYNHSSRDVLIEKGDRIAQIVIFPIFNEEIEVVNELPKSERGDNGYGSSGR